MRLANELAALALEHVRANLRAGMTEAEVAAQVGGRGARARHRLRGEGRERARLRARLVGPGIKTFTATSDRPIAEHEPTLFEIWVSADGYWCDHTKNLCPGELDPRYVELEEQLLGVYNSAVAHAATAPTCPSSTGSFARASPRPATPGSRRTRRARRRRARARAAVRAPGRLGHDPQGNGARDRAGDLLGGRRRPARRGQLAGHRREPESCAPSRTGSCAHDPRDDLYLGDLNRRASSRSGAGRSACTNDAARRGAGRRRRSRSRAEARDRAPASTSSA